MNDEELQNSGDFDRPIRRSHAPVPHGSPVGIGPHNPVISVTIGMGEVAFWIMSDTGYKVSVPLFFNEIMALFARKIALECPGDTVTHRELYDALGYRSASVTQIAGGNLRKAIGRLNESFNSLGSPRAGRWIMNRQKHGYYLNPRVNWTIDKDTFGKRRSRSVFAFNCDPRLIEINTENREDDRD